MVCIFLSKCLHCVFKCCIFALSKSNNDKLNTIFSHTQIFFTMTQTINKINSVKVSSSLPTFNTYRLMYKYGAWNTKATFICESDAEATHDADEFFNSSNIRNWSYGVALFQGNRLVKQYR